MEDRWCILRTGGARTLALAASLNEHGVRAWTPTTIARRRKSRHSTTFVDRDAPLMPTFVFADADRLAELYHFERSARSPHPAYSIFRYEHRIPIVTDAAIDRLRESEARSIPKAKRPTAAIGSTIRLDEGPYAGMDGVVRSSDGNYTLVAFGGWMQVKIETFILLSNAVDQAA